MSQHMRKRNYDETYLSLRKEDKKLSIERKPIALLGQKQSSVGSSEKEKLDEKTFLMINAFKNKYNPEENINQGLDLIKALTKTSNQPIQEPLMNPFLIQPIISNNPPALNSINPFLVAAVNNSNNTYQNPPIWNFNFNLMNNINPTFEKEEQDKANKKGDEEDDDNYDPEKEIEIKPSSPCKASFPEFTLKYESEKYCTYAINQLSLYDFEEKAYKTKGKGKLSLELFRGETNKGVIVFRLSDGMPVLFQGSIYPDLTTIEKSKKENSMIVVINKVITPTENQKVNALRIKFYSKENEDSFIGEFNGFKEEIAGKNKEDKGKDMPKEIEKRVNKPEQKDIKTTVEKISSKTKVDLVNKEIEQQSIFCKKNQFTNCNNPFAEMFCSKDNQVDIETDSKKDNTMSLMQNNPNQFIEPKEKTAKPSEPFTLCNPFLSFLQNSTTTTDKIHQEKDTNKAIETEKEKKKDVHISRIVLKQKK